MDFKTLSTFANEMAAAEKKAWKALAGYKFVMAGYWMAQWVLINRLSGLKHGNPFAGLVKYARNEIAKKEPIQ